MTGVRSRVDDIEAAWDRMTAVALDADHAEYPIRGTALATALRVLDGGYVAGSRAGGRAVPSAGAIYPYECYLVAGEHDGPAMFHADLDRRRCLRIAAAGDIGRRLRAAGLGLPPPGGSLVLIVSRPWLSMRKYGDRGYLYAQLDAAHLATNLLGHCGHAGLAAELFLRFARGPLVDLLGARGRCREVHSVLWIEPGAGTAAPAAWRVRDGRAARHHGRGEIWWPEQACWDGMSPLVTDPGAARSGVRPAAMASWCPRLPLGAPFPSGAGWGELSRRRASATRFAPQPLPLAALWQALSAGRTALGTDLPSQTPLRLTLVARSVPGAPPRAVELTAGAPRNTAPDPGDVVPACLHQEHLRDAAAFVLFHAPRAELLRPASPLVRETLFRAGALAQLFYLGATEAGLGVTAVGGFDADRWRLLAGLPATDEVVYILAFGVDDGQSAKADRLWQTPYEQHTREAR